MAARKTKKTSLSSEALEAQLASVVETEGAFVHTPRGRRRVRAEKADRVVLKQTDAPSGVEEAGPDNVASLDVSSVERLLSVRSAGRRVPVPIRSGEHHRSPYVVSLQGLAVTHVPRREDERVPVGHGLQRTDVPVSAAAPVEAYASVSADLHDDADPRFLSDQFTPATFEEAYRRVYGRFDRAWSFFSEVGSVVGNMFRRVERVERAAEESMERTIAAVEVPQLSFARVLIGFGALALVVTLPANAVALYRKASVQKTSATAAGNEAVGAAIAASEAGSIPASAEALKRASSRFREADALLSDTNSLALGIASVLPERYRSSRALLEVGDKSTQAARLFALGFDKVFGDPGRRLDERLDVMGAYARGALLMLSDASKAAASVDPSALPADYRDKAGVLTSQLEASTQAVREFAALADALSGMVGKDHLRRYLVIFQNHTELRPTGGFMGSFAEVTLDRGAVKAIRVPPGGTYDLKGQLLARVVSPEPLHLINSRWQFQDANWSPDFPTAAEKIRWFWSKSGQPTVDGVIAVNASFVEDLLELTGPIEMPEYGKVVDASNFLIETQKAVEIEYDKAANTPKKFVGDLSARLVERLKSLEREEWLKVAALVSHALETKDIQIAFTDPEEEMLAERFGWSGRLKRTPGDSLALVEANIAGQKTDGVIAEDVRHEVAIRDDGSIEDRLTLNRTHTGKKGELFRGVRNVSYLRVYVPKGSKLLSATGFNEPPKSLFKSVDEDDAPDPDVAAVEEKTVTTPEGVRIGEEGDRTVFGGWLQLDPGASQTVTLTYRLPMTASDILAATDDTPQGAGSRSPRGAYLLLLTSQAGKPSRNLALDVSAPSSWGVSWSRPADIAKDGRLTQSWTWDRDVAVGALFTPR